MVLEEIRAARGAGVNWDAVIQFLCEILLKDKPEEDRQEFISRMQQEFRNEMEKGETARCSN